MSSHRTRSSSRKRAKRLSKPAAKRSPGTGTGGTAGEWFEKLVALQARLRAPDGCPWDREQTHASLRTYLLEEAYEVLDALESGNDAKFAEEMGDLLLQIVFHSQIAAEEKRFAVTDVIREVHDKMVRRHPHVFGKTKARNAKEVLKNWEQLKVEERAAGLAGRTAKEGKEPGSLLDGVPRNAPAALEAFQLTRRAARIGFDWDDVEGILDKLCEESAELLNALRDRAAGPSGAAVEEEIGDLLFVAVNLARFLGTDPEIALKKANRKFSMRFREMERRAREQGRLLAELPREEMERLWNEGKRGERKHSVAGEAGESQ